jgi:hypothetical protein
MSFDNVRLFVLELDQEEEVKRHKEKISKSSSVFRKENELMCVDDGSHSLTTNARPKISSLASPQIAPIRRRRVIKSILVRVQRK